MVTCVEGCVLQFLWNGIQCYRHMLHIAVTLHCNFLHLVISSRIALVTPHNLRRCYIMVLCYMSVPIFILQLQISNSNILLHHHLRLGDSVSPSVNLIMNSTVFVVEWNYCGNSGSLYLVNGSFRAWKIRSHWEKNTRNTTCIKSASSSSASLSAGFSPFSNTSKFIIHKFYCTLQSWQCDGEFLGDVSSVCSFLHSYCSRYQESVT